MQKNLGKILEEFAKSINSLVENGTLRQFQLNPVAEKSWKDPSSINTILETARQKISPNPQESRRDNRENSWTSRIKKGVEILTGSRR